MKKVSIYIFVLFLISFTIGIILVVSYHEKRINLKLRKQLKECKINQEKLKKKLITYQNPIDEEAKKKLIKWILRYEKAYPQLAKDVVEYLIQNSSHPLLTLSIIAVESSFVVQATSKTGAIGLMQVQPQYWLKELKKKRIVNEKKELYDPIKNIQAGELILDQYLKDCKTLEGAISKYFTGSCRSRKSNKYKFKVLKTLGELYLIVSNN